MEGIPVKEKTAIEHLKAEATAAKGRREVLCVRTQEPPGESTFSADDILGKSDDEISQWMKEQGIRPERIKKWKDLFFQIDSAY